MVILNNAYRSHACFQELTEMARFYDCISNASFSFIQEGTEMLINYESYMFLAMKGTVDSIKLLLQKGRFNDAFVLVRKLYDDILTQIYISVTLKEKFDVFDNFSVEEVNQWLKSSYRIVPHHQVVRRERQHDSLLLMLRQFMKLHVAFIFHLSPVYM